MSRRKAVQWLYYHHGREGWIKFYQARGYTAIPPYYGFVP